MRKERLLKVSGGILSRECAVLLFALLISCKTAPLGQKSKFSVFEDDLAAKRESIKYPERQVDLVTESMRDPNLDQSIKRFYIDSLFYNDLNRLLRNNMAQALLNQNEKNPDLWRVFIAIINDPSQDKEWRLFCIQHLANSAAHADAEGKQAIRQKLLKEARNPDQEFASRALLMLDEFERAGYMPLTKDVDTIIPDVLGNPASNELSVSTVLGLIGSRKDQRYLPDVRRLARTDGPQQRVAAATLGLIGERSDIALLEGISAEPGGLLERAVQGAIQRLNQQK